VKEFKFLLFVNIACASAMMAFLSVVGPIVRKLGLQEWHAGVSVAIAGILWVILSRYWGKKSDDIGRKPILLLGVLGVCVGYFFLALFVNQALLQPPAILVSFSVLILTRGTIGAFYSAITPVSNALIADKIKETQRTPYIAKLGAANGLGMVIGPALGGYLAIYGLATPLYVFAVFPLLGALFVFLFIPRVKIKKVNNISVLKIFDSRLRLPMLAAFLTMYAVVTAQVCLGFFIMDRLHFGLVKSAVATGNILALIGVVFILAQIFVSKFKNISAFLWLKLGAATSAIGYIAVSLSTMSWLLTLGFCIATFGMGFLFPSFQTLAVNLVSQEEKGAASGTVSAAQGMGMIAGPLLSTFLYKIDPSVPFWICFVAFTFLFLSARKI
jgi:MFS family permease